MTTTEAITIVRTGITSTFRQHRLRRAGWRLWVVLHAQSLLHGPGTGTLDIRHIEDDYQRLAARHQEGPGRHT